VTPERWAYLSAKPSEYIKSGRVFFSCEPGVEFILLFLEHIGEPAMLFASDYLHFDSLFSRAHEIRGGMGYQLNS